MLARPCLWCRFDAVFMLCWCSWVMCVHSCHFRDCAGFTTTGWLKKSVAAAVRRLFLRSLVAKSEIWGVSWICSVLAFQWKASVKPQIWDIPWILLAFYGKRRSSRLVVRKTSLHSASPLFLFLLLPFQREYLWDPLPNKTKDHSMRSFMILVSCRKCETASELSLYCFFLSASDQYILYPILRQ